MSERMIPGVSLPHSLETEGEQETRAPARLAEELLSRVHDMSERPRTPVRSAPTLVSIVVPARNEARNIEPLARVVENVLGNQPFELIVVDDGSTDSTWAIVSAMAKRDARIRGLSLSRSFGQPAALAAGLRVSRGEAVITMDADFQHPPELIPELIDRWRGGANVVHTRREHMPDAGVVRSLATRCFYRFFRWACHVPIDEGMADFRLLDRRVVDRINAMPVERTFMRFLVAWMGFRCDVVPFTAPARRAGRSQYTLHRLATIGWQGLLSFSGLPSRVCLFFALSAALAGGTCLIAAIARGAEVALWVWAGTIACFVVSLQFLLFFIILEHLTRFREVIEKRPGYIVEQTTRDAEPSTGRAAPVKE